MKAGIFAVGILIVMLLGGVIPAVSVDAASTTTTPIKHVVVIFGENISFDHYFGTYPYATNPPGEPQFIPAPNTPTVFGLTGPLLTNNPNLDNPARLDRSQAITCDNNNAYTAEQKAVDGGLMDKFVQSTAAPPPCPASVVMDYYDGNTVTALWNYAQNFALNDYSFGTEYGPTIVGHLNLISGDTSGAVLAGGNSTADVANGVVVANIGSTYDDCASGPVTISMTGQNVGNLLTKAGVTWGWFDGGFKPTNVTAAGKAVCASTHRQFNGTLQADYSANYDPFMYYQSTANPHHLPPTSLAMVGSQDQANHNYDISTFFNATAAGNLPAVSFLVAERYQTGHPQNSDPLDEQTFIVNTVNYLESLPTWNSTAIIINYDDSDGWYDHLMAPVVTQSSDPKLDALLGTKGLCGTTAPGTPSDRCGYGPRLPLMVISPYAKSNYVDNTLTDQTSILRFIENNWNLGQIGGNSLDVKAGTLMNMFNFNAPPRTGTIILNPSTGEVVSNTLFGAPTQGTGASTAPVTSTSSSSSPPAITTSASSSASTAPVTSTSVSSPTLGVSATVLVGGAVVVIVVLAVLAYAFMHRKPSSVGQLTGQGGAGTTGGQKNANFSSWCSSGPP